jgi:hypothetical protein
MRDERTESESRSWDIRWVVLAAAVLILAVGAYSQKRGRPDHGVILDFENDSDSERLAWRCPVRMEYTPGLAPGSARSLTAYLKPGLYPGVEIFDPPSDWRGYANLEWTIRAPEAAGEMLHVRIDDARSGTDYDDRYEGRFPLSGGIDHIKIPVADIRRGPPNGPLDLGRVTKVVIYLYNQERDVAMTLDDIRLTR